MNPIFTPYNKKQLDIFNQQIEELESQIEPKEEELSLLNKKLDNYENAKQQLLLKLCNHGHENGRQAFVEIGRNSGGSYEYKCSICEVVLPQREYRNWEMHYRLGIH